jgi:FKBP-type peptidyl-prolyl cis-trans isomerase SlyD
VGEAYGPYEQEHVIELPKSTFMLNGRFQKDVIFEGAVIPLVNADGNRFQGLVLEVKDEVVVIDLNHPLAGKELHFKGSVVTSRPATDAEETNLI